MTSINRRDLLTTSSVAVAGLATAAALAQAVMFLASEEATAINGMDLDVTGGQLA